MATPETPDDDIPDEPDYESSNTDSETELTGGSTKAVLEVSLASQEDLDKDRVHQNLRLFTRDLLYMTELVRAISDGDISRIEDMLPILAMMFRGAGGNSYCSEILHFILNLKHIWTPEFA